MPLNISKTDIHTYMIKKFYAVLAISFIFVAITLPESAHAQRRRRPGSMTHTEAEVQNVMKVTRLAGRYIKDNATFAGNVYMVGEAGSIKIGDATIAFTGGRYTLKFGAASFDMRDASTREDRRREHISEYQYEHSWKSEKLGDDFLQNGRYEIAEQYGNIHLILYDGTSDNVFAKIPLESANDNAFDFTDEQFMIHFTQK